MRIRYELLREAPVTVPELLHPSISFGVLDSMKNYPAIGISYEAFIMPWWKQVKRGNLRLGIVQTGKYPGGVEVRDYYYVERLVEEPSFVVRSQVYDCEGYPLKSSAVHIQTDLTKREALLLRHKYAKADPTRFYDIFLQDI